MSAGSINRLAGNYSDLFGKTRQYYVDMYEVESFRAHFPVANVNLSGELAAPDRLNIDQQLIAELAFSIVKTFESLTYAQRDEHRTLERVSYAVTPVCYAYGFVGVGFDISEYTDQWRSLESSERTRLAEEILSRWRSDRTMKSG